MQVLEARTQEVQSLKKSGNDEIAVLQKQLESQQLENKKLGHGLKSKVLPYSKDAEFL